MSPFSCNPSRGVSPPAQPGHVRTALSGLNRCVPKTFRPASRISTPGRVWCVHAMFEGQLSAVAAVRSALPAIVEQGEFAASASPRRAPGLCRRRNVGRRGPGRRRAVADLRLAGRAGRFRDCWRPAGAVREREGAEDDRDAAGAPSTSSRSAHTTLRSGWRRAARRPIRWNSFEARETGEPHGGRRRR